jgi:chemotaxis signal transduction protein
MTNNNTKEFQELFKYMENVTKFRTELNDISKTWDQLILLSQLGATGIDMSQTKTNFNNLTDDLISHLADATLHKVINAMRAKAQVAVDIVIRNLFERTADIGFLATDDDIRKFLLKLPQTIEQIELNKDEIDDTNFRIAKKTYKEDLNSIKNRFQEYVAKYSVYYDIVLFDTSGNIVAKLDDTNTITQTNDSIISIATNTDEDYVETFKYHDFLPSHEKSLVYTYKVTKTNDCDEIIGFLSLCFKFENEMKGVFSRLAEKENKETILLLDEHGVSIASSDPYHIPIGAQLETELEQPFAITSFAGRDYLIKSCETNGYEGFFGLGWLGHIMIPLSSAFHENDNSIELETKILQSIMNNEDIFKKDMLEIPIKATTIQDELDRAVWNGNVSQTDENSSMGGADFARSILREVRRTGENTKKSFNTSIEELNETIILSLLDDAVFLSSLSIDIMDRNLYERANDCRWWALTSTFKEILSSDSLIDDEQKKQISNILKYINELYTVYTNLFIYDKNGVIMAVSNENETHLVGKQLTNDWMRQTLQLKNSSKYSVSSFEATPLYSEKHSYIYGASILNIDNTQSVGGIGIVFDSTPQFQDMLKDALPKKDDKTFSFFVEKNSKRIVSCSNENYLVGETLHIDDSFFNLHHGESLSQIIEFENKYYIVGSSCSNGYREYKSDSDDYINDIIALVFIEAGEIMQESSINVKKEQNQYYNYPILQDEPVQEIATFYIGEKWVGVPQSQVIEAVGLENLETPISMDDENHFRGTISHKEYFVSVLDISSFVKNDKETTKSDIVILHYDGSDGRHTVGIVVDRLGEIMKIPTQYIKPFESHLISGGMIGESIVQPPKDVHAKTLLTLLNISKLKEIAKE